MISISLLRATKPFVRTRRFLSAYSPNFMHYLMNLPEPTVETLSNGLKVATLNNEGTTSSILLHIDGGSRYETRQENGLTHLLEHLQFKGMEEIINAKGVQCKCDAGRELVTFTTECNCSDTLVLINILLTTAFKNPLCNDEITKQKDIILQEICQYEVDYYNITLNYLHSTAFQGTSLAQPVLGTSGNVCNFDELMIKTYFERVWQPRRAVLVVVGGTEHKTVMDAANEAVGDLTSHHFSEKNVYRYTGSEIRFRNDEVTAANIAVAVEGPPFDHEDTVVMNVAMNCISGWDDSQGLGKNHSNKLSHAASYFSQGFQAFNITYKDTGLWGVHFVSEPMQQGDMLHNIIDRWMTLCTCITTGEIERAKSEMKSRLLYNTETNAGTAELIGKVLFYTDSTPNLFDMLNKINDVTSKDVREVCMKYVYDKCPVVAAVGPVEGLPDYTRIRSGMYRLRF